MEVNSSSGSGSNKNRNLIIGVVVAIVLCCCCLVTGGATYYGYQAYVQAQQAINDFQNFEIPEIPTMIPFDPADPNSQSEPLPEFDLDIDVPSGGLADDETRVTAWFTLQIVSMLSQCNTPTVEGTTITVVQQPDANGEWVEEWNVNCGDGTYQANRLIFTPDESGAINVNVEALSP